jgi:NAD-dependent dihydropyrimidine dehydrogenase PreA subunit
MNEIVSIDGKKCTGCGACIKKCPQQILYLDREIKTCVVINQNQCDRLRGCERACKTGAIKIN